MKNLMLLLALSVALVGCNTVAGAGQDVHKAGESIEKG
jgi:predicted small secreted protein